MYDVVIVGAGPGGLFAARDILGKDVWYEKEVIMFF